MKIISKYDVKFDFLKKLPLGNYLYLFINKLKDL